jgi:hypothetical protein
MDPNFLVAGRGQHRLGEDTEFGLRAEVRIPEAAIAASLVAFLACCVEGALHLVERWLTADRAAELAVGGELP